MARWLGSKDAVGGDYSSSSRSRHFHLAEEALDRLTSYDPRRKIALITELFLKRSGKGGNFFQNEKAQQFALALVDSTARALSLLKRQGRPTKEHSIARQFFCATFFYFLSLFKSMFGLSISWSWFCSCHGKTGDCDAEGGAVKHLADAYEKEDSMKSSKRQTLRNAREFCSLMRRPEYAKEEEFFRKKGKGVYRRWHHWLPVRGRGAVARGAVKQAQSAVHEYGTMVKVKLRPIRRVACDGLLGAFGRVLAHASGPHVSADESNGNRHVFSECTTSVYTKCQKIQLEPRSVVDPSPVSGGLAKIGNRLTLRAAFGDFFALETQSVKTAFWLVQVSAAAQDVPPD